MKKFILGTICGATLVSAVSVGAGIGIHDTRIADDTSLIVNGKQVDTEIVFAIKDGETNGKNYVSARDLAEALGATVDWNGYTKEITVTSNTPNIENTSDKTTSSNTVAVEPKKMTLQEYNSEKQKIETNYKNQKQSYEMQIKAIDADIQGLNSSYNAIDYSAKIKELEKEAAKYKKSVTITGQDHYNEILEDLNYYKNLNSSNNSHKESLKLQYEAQKKQLETSLSNLEDDYKKALKELDAKYNS